MSKVVVYILDRLVWLLLITALTTQALQTAGILETPKSYQELSYSQGDEYNFQLSVGDSERGKRETQERSKVIDSLFNMNEIDEQGRIFFIRIPTKVIRAKM